jgi:exonuclease III
MVHSNYSQSFECSEVQVINPTQSSDTQNITTTQNSKIKNLLNISTLNVRGLNERAKLEALVDNLPNNKSVMCCSETKINTFNYIPKKVLKKTIITSSPSTSSKNGAAIIIGEDIAKHIFKITTTNEFWCAVHLKFKPKVDIVIIAIYLPHDKESRIVAVKSLRQFIGSQKQEFQLVLAGDFNSFPLNSPSVNAPTTHFKQKVYAFLDSWHDTAEIFNSKHIHTHITSTSMSRIDQIWITSNLASRLLDYRVFNSTAINTDHKQVQVILS